MKSVIERAIDSLVDDDDEDDVYEPGRNSMRLTAAADVPENVLRIAKILQRDYDTGGPLEYYGGSPVTGKGVYIFPGIILADVSRDEDFEKYMDGQEPSKAPHEIWQGDEFMPDEEERKEMIKTDQFGDPWMDTEASFF